jgi:hypothetical protein
VHTCKAGARASARAAGPAIQCTWRRRRRRRHRMDAIGRVCLHHITWQCTHHSTCAHRPRGRACPPRTPTHSAHGIKTCDCSKYGPLSISLFGIGRPVSLLSQTGRTKEPTSANLSLELLIRTKIALAFMHRAARRRAHCAASRASAVAHSAAAGCACSAYGRSAVRPAARRRREHGCGSLSPIMAPRITCRSPAFARLPKSWMQRRASSRIRLEPGICGLANSTWRDSFHRLARASLRSGNIGDDRALLHLGVFEAYDVYHL